MKKGWSGKSDGTPWMLKTLTRWLGYVDVRVVYCVMAVVIVFYIIFGFRHSVNIYRYFRRCHRDNPLKALARTYATYFQFGQAIMDRMAVYAGRKYKIEHDDVEREMKVKESEEGMIILGSHIGNYEMAGYLMGGMRKPMNVLLYVGENATVMRNRIEHFGRNGIKVITVDETMDHVYAVNKALQEGEIVSLHADRRVNSEKSLDVDILGRTAHLPAGPFLLAAVTGKRVVGLFVMKTKWDTYKIYCREYKAEGGVRQAAAEMARQYGTEMERITRMYPTQWYNFYDFWK